MTDTLTDAQRAIIGKVEKLLALAGRNSNENEASAAAAKAEAMLAEHNLSMAEVERAQGAVSGKREMLKQSGGMYSYQRRLWREVADLNFCVYLCYRERNRERMEREANGRNGGKVRMRYTHRLIGRTVNVAATKVMASYLEGAAERLCRERLHERGEGSQQFYSRWAVSYREGAVDRIISRIYDRRSQRETEERLARAEQAKRAGGSTATALTLADVRETERAANYDFQHGEGAWARREARRAELAAEAAREEAAWAAWAKANPEEARKQEQEAARKAEAAARRSFGRGGGGREPDWGAYSAGQKAGEGIGLDPQTGTRSERRIGNG